ncbi:MAG: fimbrillin family protein [Bacteroidales bacterium]|nr:fimbrillin family protein [Bacteroidales bacterium]
MKKLIYIISCILLTACNDDVCTTNGTDAGAAMRFEAIVIDQPEGRGMVLNVNDNDITRDFKPGDSFGLFIIDSSGNFVTQIDGKNAHNIKLTTPDGKAWNLNSDIKEVVHKLGYKYVAYYPYSETFNDCTSIDGIKALLTAPADDQSMQEATDWMYTDETSPQTNAVTTLKFYHRYAKIEIYNSFTQEHINDWVDKYKFTKTVDNNNVERYRYILDTAEPQTLSVSGTYSIGNELTGMKQFSYNCNDIAIKNGRHAIVYTYRMDERCAIDLGLPSGVRWSPINLGTETSTYMDEEAIASLGNVLGKRLAWGELFEKDTYNYASYINDPYLENGSSKLPADIAETVYDPARQYWGGHWTLPSSADIQEFIDNTEIVSTENVASSELGKDICKITFRSKRNGKEITMLTNGYATNATVSQNLYFYYMTSSRAGYAYCGIFNNNPSPKVTTTYRYVGLNVRPVLKERYIYTYDNKKDIIVRHINDLEVDLGITKTVTENGEKVTYKLLWSPFNYGVEKKTDLQTYNGAPINEDIFLKNCNNQPGMRLAWGDIEERPETEKFSTDGYKSSSIAQKYAWHTDDNTNLDKRDLLPEDDIVQLNWPDGWYIPTALDYQLLADSTIVTTEKINEKTWFRLTSKNNGNSILIPATYYIDDAKNEEKWSSDAYLQSSTIGYSTSTPSKPICYALKLSGTTASLANNAGRPTGLMVRPVRYVRVN